MSAIASESTPTTSRHIDQLTQLLSDYPELIESADAACWKMLSEARLVTFDAGTLLFDESMECNHLMLIVEGRIRIYKESTEGREVTLYRAEPGELCVPNLHNLMNGKPYPVNAQTESPVRGLAISRQAFKQGMNESESFRNYVLRTLTQRLSDMAELVSGIAFERLDLRVACWLMKQYERNNGKPVHVTHSELAHELGTTREMISRILKDFEHKRCIKLARGKILLQCKHSLSLVSEGKAKLPINKYRQE